MAQKPNPVISEFRKRVEWIVLNLDPDPVYRRFVSEINDVFAALEEAKEKKSFAVGPYERVPGRRTWETALKTDRVPQVYLDWLYTLYSDLVPSQLEAVSFEEFRRLGEEIQAQRDRWRPAIRFFAEQRSLLLVIARNYYRECDFSSNHNIGDLEFPLLTQEGWIRTRPIVLEEHTESTILSDPDPGRIFEPRRLPGLRGDYVAYKGGLAYASRRVVKTEPQHNGEVFCARSVIKDNKGFVGFRYFLSRYFEYINTCEVLGAELADWVLSHPREITPQPLQFRGNPEDAFDLSNRATYPGVNCLSIFLNYSERRLPRGNYFLLHKRDETQLQAQNTVHVVPAGGHQGYAKGGWREDTAIWRTMVREFAEELFDMEDLSKQPESWEDFLSYKEVNKIRTVFFQQPDPAAKVYLHGFGLDPITLKPEILITIVINWEKVPTGPNGFRLKFNWELQQKRKKSGTRHQWAKLSERELLLQAEGGRQTIGDIFLDTLPAGAACLMQTARHYRLMGLPEG